MDVECEEINGLVDKGTEKFEDENNEKSLDESREKHVFPSSDEKLSDVVVDDCEKDNVENSVIVSSKNVSYKSENTIETSRPTDHVYENGKKKIKEEKPPTKVVVRRLPPSMTKEIFLDQASPIPPYDYMYFVSGDPSYGMYSYSRAYLNFINQEDVFIFTRTFDNYVFLDNKGQEYPAIVEFSPFQRVPKLRSKKKDTLTGTIESDPMYLSFKENLLAEVLEKSKPGAKTIKQHYFETEISTAEEVNTTPLLEFLKQRRAEKARIRDERREEKKRKEAERKLKQKTKDKKNDVEEEETTTKDLKVLQSKDRRDGKDKDIIKCAKKKEEKEKLLKENRTREFKNRSGKSYQEERIRQAERREERKKETTGVTFERKSESQSYDSKEVSTEMSENVIQEEKEKSRSFIEKKRTYENKKRSDSDDWKVEGDGDKKIKTERIRGERRQRERERKRREEFASRKGFDKKSTEIVDKKRSRTYKSVSNVYSDTKDNVGNVKNTKTPVTEGEPRDQNDLKVPELGEKENRTISADINETKNNEGVSQRRKSLESIDISTEKREDKDFSNISKRRNSLESVNNSTKFSLKSSNEDRNSRKIVFESIYKGNNKEITKYPNYGTKKSKHSVTFDTNNVKEVQNKSSDKNQGSTKQEIKNINEHNNSAADTKSKSSEISSTVDGNHSSGSKDPRTDRRIRNKDRPSLQIYRPGMGKFSKQRLEKEKVLGSSTEVDSPSHSPSPTPKVKFPS